MASTRLVAPSTAPSQRASPSPGTFAGAVSLLLRMARIKKTESVTSVPEASDLPLAVEAPEPQRGFRGVLEKVFGIDVRSLALFRICLALIMIGDLLYRAQDLEAHYTDAGVLPIALVSVYQQQHWWWSIHTLHPALPLEIVLFLIAGLFALSLLVGYRTRTVSVVCWLLLISLQNRNTLVLTGGDTMLRVLAFWAMFLPLGVRWSVDRALDKTAAPMPQRIFSVGTVALIAQLAMVYLFGALYKTGPTWHTDYTAIYYALSIGQFATPLAKSLLHYPDLLKTLTFVSWHLEFLAPILIVVSAFSGRLRTAIVLVYMCFHVSLGLCLELGLFPIIGALAWVILLPDWFWRRFFRLSARLPLSQPPAFVAALTAQAAAWGMRLHPQSVSVRTPRVVQLLVAFFLVYVVCWNIRITDFNRHAHWFPTTWNWIGEVVRLDQSWELFAPDPMQSQGWIVVEAVLKDQEVVDLKAQTTHVTYEAPALISATYYNERWRKYLMNISDDTQQNQSFTYASYLGNRWNSTHSASQHVKKVSIFLVRSLTLPKGRRSEPERILLFKGEYPD
jgi:hypothetical protein